MSTSLRLIVSGGSRGLGLTIVEDLLARGHRVATFSRKATAAMGELEAKHPERFTFLAFDSVDTPAVEGFVASVANRFGGIDGLVNNAAIGQDHLLAHMPHSKIGEILDINLRAPIVLTRAVVRQMLRGGGGGRIVTISSICASRGFPGLSVYSATKGALESFTRSLARELGEKQIYVNAVAPGFFASEMSALLRDDQMETIRRRTPTGKLSEGHQIVPVIRFLLEDAENITGEVFAVDGGASV